MPLVAPASKTVRNKNFLIVVLCVAFAAWFGYDGWHGWPNANDKAVKDVREQARDLVPPDKLPMLVEWEKSGGWRMATPAQREEVNTLFTKTTNLSSKFPWHSALDILVQKVITAGLVVLSAAAVWWYLRCQKRRAIADETGISPADGVQIPWNAITLVDNTRWEKSGIVHLTYVDAAGTQRKAVLDEYHLDDLRPVLQELAIRADRAEFIPPPEQPAATS